MTSQDTFRAGLLDPTRNAPKGLQDGQGRPAGKRYDVYRNNVTHSLLDALETAFPFTRKLIGPSRFATIAPDFVRAHPPTSPLMMYYGDEFPSFLWEHEVSHQIAYLPDAARLDLAIRQSYHAADAPPFDPSTLTVDPDTLMGLRLDVAPSTKIIRSKWPLHDIWRFAHQETTQQPRALAQDILITRINFDPMVHLLADGAADWLEALAAGQSFGEALEQLPEDFDLAQNLASLLSYQALAGKN